MALLRKMVRPGLQLLRARVDRTLLVSSRFISSSNTGIGTDYQEIGNTINSFLLCMDRNRSDGFANLFTDTGTCEIVKAGALVTGQESLKELCQSLHTRFTPCLHMESNIHIKMISSHEAENESYWMAVLGGDIVSTGSHEDELVKCAATGLWRFQRRIIRHHWTKDGGFEDQRSKE